MTLREMKRYAFTQENLHYAPEERGVFVLWDADEAVYIGRAQEPGIKAILLQHQVGDHGRCTRSATHYSWEISLWEGAREAELLADFFRDHQRQPRCHKRAAQ